MASSGQDIEKGDESLDVTFKLKVTDIQTFITFRISVK